MKLVWSPEAIADLSHVRAYIALDNPKAARKQVLHIVETLEILLPTNPNSGRAGRAPGTRELVIPQTPYIVPYRVRDTTVEILRIYHSTRQWPGTL